MSSDSESDMPEAVSFSTAKKSVTSKQKELNKAAQAAIASSKKKKIRKVNDEVNFDDIEVEAKQAPKKKIKTDNLPQQPAKSLSAKVDANLMSLINEELPQKKIKQLEGKFAVIERSSSIKNLEKGPKQLTLQSEVSKASKNLGSGVQIVFSKISKPLIVVNTSATDFLAARQNLSNSKRQPISRIIPRK